MEQRAELRGAADGGEEVLPLDEHTRSFSLFDGVVVVNSSRPLRVIPCAVCGREKWRETNPVVRLGHYRRLRLRASCKCVEAKDGRVIKVGPLKEC